MMRKILAAAGIAIAGTGVLIGLTAGSASASDSCEGQPDGHIVLNSFERDDGTTYSWIFECYGDGKARYVGYIQS